MNNFIRNVLFIGAHPDDLELGSWTALYKLVKSGCNVDCIIVTTEDGNDGKQREVEFTQSIASLNTSIRIFFLKEHDGKLVCDKNSVSKMRKLIKKTDRIYDVIFCHTDADCHNDHKAVRNIVHASFRESCIIEYPVVNSFIESEFRADIFSFISPEIIVSQKEALACHQSQKNRINDSKISLLRKKFGSMIGVDSADAYKLIIQTGCNPDIVKEVLHILDDSPCSQLLGDILRDNLFVINGMTVFRRTRTIDESIRAYGKSGVGLLSTFAFKIPAAQEIMEVPCLDPSVHSIAETRNILLNGGSVSNAFTREYFEHFIGIVYKIDYSMPNYEHPCILDMKTGKRIYAKYSIDDYGIKSTITEDYGIITWMKNPLNPDKWLIGCMGIHINGSRGCFKALIDNAIAAVIVNSLSTALSDGFSGVQLIITIKTGESPKIHKNSLKFIK